VRSEAYLSADRKYRWWLFREWNKALPCVAVIGSNPSRADEKENDPTIRKVIGFAARLEYGSILMLNVGAYRATDPKEWRAAKDPIGTENTIEHLVAYTKKFDVHLIIAAWGRMGLWFPVHCEAISKRFSFEMPYLWCLDRNKDGTPRHPLYVSYHRKLERFYYAQETSSVSPEPVRASVYDAADGEQLFRDSGSSVYRDPSQD
jgi:hypothetical protein